MVNRAVLLLLLLAGSVSDVSAQIVRGVIAEADGGAPIPGVFVVLVDSTGRARTGVLTDARGWYAIGAAVGGTYRVRAERIGHASTLSEPFVLTAGNAITVDVRVQVAPIELAAVDVASMSRCVRRPVTGQRTAQLWEEARKALSVAHWTEKQRRFQFEMRSWSRDLDARTLTVRNEQEQYQISHTRPYGAVSIDSLTRYGFARNDRYGMIYYGPDAEVLLSDEFLDRHCFHSVVGSGDNAGQFGLVFQPAKDMKLPDVKGTLWLDARTYELRNIDFSYVNIPAEYRVRGSGGRTEFQKLADGAWIVSRWYIRMPTEVGRMATGDLELRALQEEGGEVISVRDEHAKASSKLVSDGAVSGVVFDSIGGRPLANAAVYISGTVHRTMTNEAGRFELNNIPPGRYLIAFTHPLLDSLPALPAPRSVQLNPLDTANIELSVPPARTTMANVCSAIGANDRLVSGAIFGTVRDERGNAMANVRVRAESAGNRDRMRSGNRYADEPLTVETETDAAGRYILCGVPFDVIVDVSVLATNRSTPAQPVRLTRVPYRRVDFSLVN